jgi:hypothetical protein
MHGHMNIKHSRIVCFPNVGSSLIDKLTFRLQGPYCMSDVTEFRLILTCKMSSHVMSVGSSFLPPCVRQWRFSTLSFRHELHHGWPTSLVNRLAGWPDLQGLLLHNGVPTCCNVGAGVNSLLYPWRGWITSKDDREYLARLLQLYFPNHITFRFTQCLPRLMFWFVVSWPYVVVVDLWAALPISVCQVHVVA